ncbi:MAG: peptidyl-prolyl cis-trans isomerase [Rhizomicrobium sp.]
MLQQIRKFATSRIVAFAFFGPLIASFAIWGIADVFRGTADTNVFTLGSTPVPVGMFQREYHNALRRAATPPSPEEGKAIGQEIITRMTLATALDNLADSLGLTVTDGRVRQRIQAIASFKGPLGNFDHDTFLRLIDQAGYTEDEFVSVSRKDVARGQLLHAVEDGFAMPPDYAQALFAYINEVRAAEYVTVSPASVGEIAPPSETVLAAYVKAHPERFSTPEYRAASIAWIAAEDLAPTMAATDKQIQDEIDTNRSDYFTPEKRVLEQIAFKSEDEAKAAKAALAAGKTFDALAVDRKLQPADYKLGELTQANLAIDPARAQAAFALAENAVSDPVKGNLGWVLLHVTKITPGLSKSRDEIRQVVQRKLALSHMADMSNIFTDAVADGASVEEAARKAGLHYTHVAAIDDKGLAPDGSKIADASNPDLLAAIFKADIGDEGDPFQTADGRLFAIQVDGTTPPKVRPLDAVRAAASAAWIAEQRAQKLRAKAAALASEATTDHSLAPVAAALGAPIQSSPALTRRSNEGLFNQATVRALFAAAPGSALALAAGDGSYLVMRVSGVLHPPLPQNNLQFIQGVGELSREISGDFTVSLARAEEEAEGGLKINQKLVDSTVGGSGS